MGEMADSIINGETCSLCGCIFKDPNKKDTLYEHGYPVACRDCWEFDCGYDKALVDTF